MRSNLIFLSMLERRSVRPVRALSLSFLLLLVTILSTDAIASSSSLSKTFSIGIGFGFFPHALFAFPLSRPTSLDLQSITKKKLATTSKYISFTKTIPTTSTSLFISNTSNNKNLTPLPKDISPFVRKSPTLANDFRVLALRGLQEALKDDKNNIDSSSNLQFEVEFPPLLLLAKSQFDDFDNVQQLEQNRDWCIEWLPALQQKNIWFVLPDLKEVELAKEVWAGQRYRQAALFSSIEAVTNHVTDGNFAKPWGASIANGVSNLFGGNLLGDESALDPLPNLKGEDGDDTQCPNLIVVCQPGEGGPVEDWINVNAIHDNRPSPQTAICVVNGALDKVRDGYYPGAIFPALATTFDFYRNFEGVFVLKPISDKGVYGWIFRVYPEPWQVILQTPTRNAKEELEIEDTVVLTSESRPTYAECVQALLDGAAKKST